MPDTIGRYTPEQVEQYYANGDWQDAVLWDLLVRQASEHPDRTFVTDGTSELTYGELCEQALRVAAGLQGLGVQRGDRVLVQLPNWAEFATIVVALSRVGAILVPTVPTDGQDEVGSVLEHSGARVIIGPQRFHEVDHLTMYRTLAERVDTLEHLVIVRPEEPAALDGAIDFDLLVAPGNLDAIDRGLGSTASPDEGTLLVYASDTASRPTGCLHSFNTVHAAAKLLNERLQVVASDTLFTPSPVARSTGLITGLLMPLLVGASTHLMPAWVPAEGLQQIREYGCSVAVTPTAFLSDSIDAYEADRDDLSSMRIWVCAGSPIPESVIEEARALFPTCQVLSMHGGSETIASTLCAPEDPPEKSVTSDGRALADSEVRVVDQDGHSLPAGERGAIAYRGPSHMLGYYRDDEQTDALFTSDGLARTGDSGVMDDDGFVRVAHR